jgi:hypothetical protein
VLFVGDDDADQLVKVTKVMGTEEMKVYAEKYGIRITKKDHPNLKL